MSRRTADLLVDCLAGHGVDRVFCVPGESYLPVLDALRDRNDIETVVCRHESGAGYMAVADAKLTFRPGVCFVSRGPGAANAAIAVHTAEQDAVPFVLFIGQVPRHQLGRRAFQEVDYAKTFADMAKGVWTVHQAGQLPEIVARAFAVATSPTPGPVVVVLPEDVLDDMTDAAAIAPLPGPHIAAGEQEAASIAKLVARAERPLLIAGGGLAHAEGRAALLHAAEALQLPVVLSFKRQDLFANNHPNYAGHLGFKIPRKHVALLDRADLILAIGTRLGEVTSQGYTFPAAPNPRQPLIHVHADSAQLGRVYACAQAITAEPARFLRALARHAQPAPSGRGAWIADLHAYVAAQMPWRPPEAGVVMGSVAAAMAERLSEDAILITDAGNFSGWLHRHFPFNGRHILLGAVGGAMGFGVPAAVAAGLRHREKDIVTWVGDGGFLMTGNELATAVKHGVRARIFIANNGSYGTIRMHQERAYPGRPAATDLVNPDFAKLAEAFGARGLVVTREQDVAGAVDEALAHDGPVVVDMRTSVEQISAFASLQEIAGR